ncbi:MAG: ABC transporter substrate-binding protein [Burkholderiales bacterium]
MKCFLRSCAALCLAAVLPAAAAELKLGFSSEVTTVDPHFLAAQANLALSWHLFEPLVTADAQSRTVPALAQSWRAVDATTWEFKLRPGVKFQDGSAFTADDVAFSLARPLNIKGSPGGFAPYVRTIASVQVVDPLTVRIRTTRPYGPLLQELNSVAIVSRKAAANATPEHFDSGAAAIGTGPFRLVRFARGDRIELARFDGYWGDKPAWDRVTIRMIASEPSRTAALLAGDVDAIETIPPADLARFRRNPAYHVAQTPSWRTIYFLLDQKSDMPPGVTDAQGKPLARNPYKDARVRKALSLAIDRAALAERVMEGMAVPAANMVGPAILGHDPALKAAPADPAAARKLLAEAGYPDGFALTVAAPNNRYPNDEQTAQAVAQMLARAGFKAQVVTLPFQTYLTKARAGEFSLPMVGWGSSAADLALRSLAMTPNADKGHGAWNWGGYANAKLDAAVEASFAAVDEKKRAAAAREANALAMNDVALLPLYHQLAAWAMKRDIDYAPRTDEFTLAQHFRPAK